MAVITPASAPAAPLRAGSSDESTSLLPTKLARARPLFDPEIVRRATASRSSSSIRVTLAKNPVMFVVEVGAALTTVFVVRDIVTGAAGALLRRPDRPVAVVHGAVRQLRRSDGGGARQGAGRHAAQDQDRRRRQARSGRRPRRESCRRRALRAGDVVICEPGDVIPGDGEVIEGVASIDESVITGESAPVIRESGGDRSAVTGGTRVLSDWIKVRITSNPGETFLDRMIALVEGAQRQKTPNEIALNILIAGPDADLPAGRGDAAAVRGLRASARSAPARVPSVAVLVSLLVCLIPTTIGGLLSAIGIAGMDRVMQHNVLAMSGRAVEASGDVHTLLLDKTGTITLGNRQAVEFLPLGGVDERELADAAQLSSLADETPEGRSIVVLAKEQFQLRGREVARQGARLHPVLGLHAHERRRPRRPPAAQGRGRRDRGLREGAGRRRAGGLRRGGRSHLADGRHAAGRRRRPAPARPGSPQGRRQGRHEGAHRPAPADGHPLGDDHRRQPAHGRRHRQRGRRRRLPRAGHAEGQARIHPQGAGRGPPRGDDRRRHQRRARAGSGRRRRGDEHRAPWPRRKPATWSISTATRPS